MSDTPSILRELVEKYRSGKASPRYPEALQHRIAAYVHQQRANKVSYTLLSRDIGISPTALAKWARKFPSPKNPAFLPVRVQDTEPTHNTSTPAISITSPNGWRINGIDIHELIAIIGRIA